MSNAGTDPSTADVDAGENAEKADNGSGGLVGENGENGENGEDGKSGESRDSHTAFDRAFEIVASAIADGRIPGAVLALQTGDGKRRVRSAGLARCIPEPRAMGNDTWFDLASLTKVVFTTPRILMLAESGAIDLDAPLISVLPDLRQYAPESWIRRVTFRECLAHQTPFPAVEPIYTYGSDAELLRAFVLQRDWAPGPAVYSDINFILLGLALERLLGKRLRAMDAGPGFAFASPPDQTAATEDCTWRQRVLCGEVHDENCAALAGAGHAGLFGTADALMNFAQGMLDGGTLSAAVVQTLRTPVSAQRTIGWERRHSQWSGGDLCSPQTIGHTGFTGTGLWIDFASRTAWTLLTNRIHPTRHRESGIAELRRSVANALYRQ